MRLHIPLLICGLCLVAPLVASRVAADPPTPVTVSITKPLTPTPDVLAALAKQTGQTILTDDTAVSPLGIADLSAPTLDAMLNSLKTLDAGLVWQKVYLPQEAPLPTGDDLSAQVRALKAITGPGLIVADPQATLSFSRRPAGAQATPPAGMRLVYLVTDEAVRAQREAAKAAKAAKPQEAGTPVDKTSTGMQSVADTFSQMTPDQQRQALPLMFGQFRRIMQSMDPGVRDQLRQQFGRRGALGGPGNGQ